MAEFVLIVIGVLSALALDDWRAGREDRALELHLLSGIRADLVRDLEDLQAGIEGAKARMAGADELLGLLGDSDTGVVRVPPMNVGDNAPRILTQSLEEELSAARAAYPQGSVSAQEALLMATAMLRLDVSNATYSEATASGQVDVIRDLDLRSAIAQYYFDAGRYGNTVDERVESSVERLVASLASAGLSASAQATDEAILSALRGDQDSAAELKNVRYYAAYQMERHMFVLSIATVLLDRMESITN